VAARPCLALLALALLTPLAVARSPGHPVIDGVAYAHISLTITFEGGEGVSYELAGSVYPRLQIDRFCVFTGCKTGIATPFGYGYNAAAFEHRLEYHVEEALHLRQWEALGPGFLLAYAVTGGEPFEPYMTRDSVIASAGADVPYWDLDRMWRPPEELTMSFPQFRAMWTPDGAAKLTFLPGYAELAQAALETVWGAIGPAGTVGRSGP